MLEKLSDAERDALLSIDPVRRTEILRYAASLSKEELEMLDTVVKKSIRGESLTQEEYLLLIEYPELMAELSNIPIIASALSKLSPEDIAKLLLISKTSPELLELERKKRVVEERVERVELPKRPWRSLWPFRTSSFIRGYLLMKGDEGATPYEVYKAFIRALSLAITDESFREEIKKRGGITTDGFIDERIAMEVFSEKFGSKIIRLKLPIYHKPSYNSFWRYFFILENLGLIERIGDREWKNTIFRQRYRIVMDRKDDEVWLRPQEVMYPLTYLGRSRYESLMEEVAMIEGVTVEELKRYPPDERRKLIIEAFIGRYPERIEYISSLRGISSDELINIMRTSRYRSEEKIIGSIDRLRKICDEKISRMRRKI